MRFGRLLQSMMGLFIPRSGKAPIVAVLAVGALSLALGLALAFSNLASRIEWALYDRVSLAVANLASSPENVAVVAIDEPSYQEIGLSWPWPRAIHAELITGLARAGARAAVMDLVFDIETDEMMDGILVDAAGGSLPVVLAADVQTVEAASFSHVQRVLPFPALRAAAAGIGMAPLFYEPDGAIRRFPLAVSGTQSLAAAAQQSSGGGAPAVRGAGAGGRDPAAADSPWAAGSLPLSEASREERLIRFYGTPRRGIETVSYYQALSPEEFLPEGFFAGRTVFVGFSLGAETELFGRPDHYTTPIGERTPGVEIHATAFSNLLEDSWIRDPLGSPLILLLFCVAFGAAVLWPAYRIRPALTAALFAGCAALLVAALYLGMYFFSVRVPVARPLIAAGIVLLGVGLYRFVLVALERRMIIGAFKHYLAPSIVDQILDDPAQLKLGGAEYVVTVLFTDLAGFTSIAERMSPGELTSFLGRYFREMVDTLLSHGATLDKFIGDAIMAYFGCPVPHPDHADRACRAALEMQERLATLNEAWEQEELPRLAMRIGINTGRVVAGNMGTDTVFNFTLLGDEVNLASRLEGINKQYGTSIVISSTTREALTGTDFAFRTLDRLRVKGKNEPVEILELGAPEGELVTLYEQALELYKRRRWDQAVVLLERLLARDPDDGPGNTLMIRCREYMEIPPAEEWDGVYVATSK